MNKKFKFRPYSQNFKIFIIVILIFINFNLARAEELNLRPEVSLNFNPLDTVSSAGIKGISAQELLGGFKFNLPFNVKSLNIDTNTPISPKFNTSQDLPDINLKQFLTPKDVSSNDLGEAAKAIITLVIEIFLVVISITSQILKLILEFLR